MALVKRKLDIWNYIFNGFIKAKNYLTIHDSDPKPWELKRNMEILLLHIHNFGGLKLKKNY